MNVAILNYNIGNLASVQNALIHASRELTNTTITIESNPHNLARYDKILLPGVGAFGDAIAHLRAIGMDKAIKEFAQSGKYILGICLGMQLLFTQSEEFGIHEGLGLLEGKIESFDRNALKGLKIPHVGWNQCHLTEQGSASALFAGLLGLVVRLLSRQAGGGFRIAVGGRLLLCGIQPGIAGGTCAAVGAVQRPDAGVFGGQCVKC